MPSPPSSTTKSPPFPTVSSQEGEKLLILQRVLSSRAFVRLRLGLELTQPPQPQHQKEENSSHVDAVGANGGSNIAIILSSPTTTTSFLEGTRLQICDVEELYHAMVDIDNRKQKLVEYDGTSNIRTMDKIRHDKKEGKEKENTTTTKITNGKEQMIMSIYQMVAEYLKTIPKDVSICANTSVTSSSFTDLHGLQATHGDTETDEEEEGERLIFQMEEASNRNRRKMIGQSLHAIGLSLGELVDNDYMNTDNDGVGRNVDNGNGNDNHYNTTASASTCTKDHCYSVQQQLHEESLELFHSIGVSLVMGEPGGEEEQQHQAQSFEEDDTGDPYGAQEQQHSQYEFNNDDCSKDIGSALHALGFVCDCTRRYEEAMTHYKNALRMRKKAFGGEYHLDVAKTLNNMGCLSCELEQFDSAMSYLQRALVIRRAHLQNDDIELADTLQWIASVLREFGDYDDALLHFEEVLYIKEKSFGRNSSEVANVLFNLAVVQDDLGQYDKSMLCYKEALRIRKLCGKQEDTALTLHCMANVCSFQGDHFKALEFYKSSLCIRERLLLSKRKKKKTEEDEGDGDTKTSNLVEKMLCDYEESYTMAKLLNGEDHGDTLGMLFRMGELYRMSNDQDNAISGFQSVTRSLRRIKDEDNPHFLESINHLSEIFEAKGNYSQSLAWYKKELLAKKRKFGEENEQVSDSLHNMGTQFKHLLDWDNALICFQEAHRLRKQELGDCMKTAVSRHLMGVALDQLNRGNEAMDCFHESLDVLKIWPGNYTVMIKVLHDIANNYVKQSKIDVSLEYYEEAMLLTREKLGNEHEDMVDALYNLGNVYAQKGEFDAAIEHFEEALQVTAVTVGNESLMCANILHNLGIVQGKIGFLQEALLSFDHAYRIYHDREGEDLYIANIAHNMGCLLDKQQQFDRAEQFYQEALSIRIEKLGKNHLDVATTLVNYGISLAKRDFIDQATECFQSALRARKKQLGNDHISVAAVLHNMAKIYNDSDEFDKCIVCYTEAIRIRSMAWGIDNIEVSNSQFNIAVAYESKLKYDTALEHYMQALNTRKQKLGEKNLDLAITLRSVGMLHLKLCRSDGVKYLSEALLVYKFQPELDMHVIMEILELLGSELRKNGDYENSLKYYLESLKHTRAISGDDHLDVSQFLFICGELYSKLNNISKALVCFTGCYHIRKEKIGEHNIETGRAARNLAEMYAMNMNHDKAMKYYHDALDTYKLCSEYSVELADIFEAMGDLYSRMDDDKKSIIFLMESMTIFEKIVGPESIEYSRTLHNMGRYYNKMGVLEKANELLSEALQKRKALLGAENLDAADSLFELALVQEAMGSIAEAYSNYKEVLRVRQLLLPKNNLSVASTLMQLGGICLEMEDLLAAFNCYDKALEIYNSELTEDDIEIAHCICSIAAIRDREGSFDEALSLYTDALKRYNNILDHDHLCKANVYNAVGVIHAKQGGNEKAVEMIREAVRMRKDILGRDNCLVADTMHNLGNILDDIGKKDQAEKFFSECLRVYRLKLGDNHVDTANSYKCLGDTFEKKDPNRALDLYLEALKIFRKLDGEDNPNIVDILWKVANIYVKIGDTEKALVCARRVLLMNQKMLGDSNIKTARTMQLKGSIHQLRGEDEEALDCYVEASGVIKSKPECDRLDLAKLLITIAKIHAKQGHFQQAIPRASEALEMYQLELGKESEKATHVSHLVGQYYNMTNDFEKANQFLTDSLRNRRTLFGAESLDVAESLCELGVNLESTYDIEGAIKCYSEAVSIRAAKVGKTDDDCVGELLSHLGCLYETNKNTEKALRCYNTALDILNATREKNDVEIPDIMERIANIYNTMNNKESAISLYTEVLRRYSNILGEDHLKIGSICSCLGALQTQRGDHAKAIDMMRESIRIRKLNLGHDDSLVADSIFSLARILLKTENNEQATICYLECLRIYRLQSDSEMVVADILQTLGDIFEESNFDQTLEYYNEAVKLYQEKNPNCPELQKVIRKAGNIHATHGNIDRAIEMFNLELQSMSETKDIETANAYLNIATMQEMKGDHVKAIEFYAISLSLYRSNMEHTNVLLQVLYRMGDISSKTHQYEAANEYFNEILSTCRSDGVEKHPKIFSDALYGMGEICSEQGHLHKAISFYEECLQSRESQHGRESLPFALVSYLIGNVYLKLHDFGKSMHHLAIALRIQKLHLEHISDEQDHVDVSNSLYKIGIVMKSVGDVAKAEMSFKSCMEVRKSKLGDSHEEVAKVLNQLGLVASKMKLYTIAVNYWEHAIQIYQDPANDLADDHPTIQTITTNIATAQRFL